MMQSRKEFKVEFDATIRFQVACFQQFLTAGVCVQNNEVEAAKMKVKEERQKKLRQKNTKAKSKMSKAQKKRMEREKAKG